MNKLLDVRNVSVNYGAVRALKDISFHVNQGEIVAFLGSNGAGKTTTMRTLSGLLKAAHGEVFFDGQPITSLPSDKIVKLGISQSPEGRMVFPDMTVRQNLLMGAFSRKVRENALTAELDYIFDMFPRLKERLTQPAMTLSGGEQQMLAIGRALMAKPKLLLLDEPSLGIAPILVQTIFEKVVELNRNGMTILLAEQNARMALKISHRAYVLQVGEVTRSGPAAELLNDPEVKRAYLGG